jgi:hypothetical protein
MSSGRAAVAGGDDPRAVPLASEALTLARQIGDPALVATSLLGVGCELDIRPSNAIARADCCTKIALFGVVPSGYLIKPSPCSLVCESGGES